MAIATFEEIEMVVVFGTVWDYYLYCGLHSEEKEKSVRTRGSDFFYASDFAAEGGRVFQRPCILQFRFLTPATPLR